MQFKIKRSKPIINYGDLITDKNGISYMVCFNTEKEPLAVNMSTGEILDYGYYVNQNIMCESVGLELLCRNKDLILSNY